MKVWITKYALTEGILEFDDAELCNEKHIRVKGSWSDHTFDSYFHKPDWHNSEAEAKSRAIRMVEARLKSLRKSLAKMEELLEKFRREE